MDITKVLSVTYFTKRLINQVGFSSSILAVMQKSILFLLLLSSVFDFVNLKCKYVPFCIDDYPLFLTREDAFTVNSVIELLRKL